MNGIIIILLLVISIIALIAGFNSVKKSRTATEFFLLNRKLRLPSFIGTMVASNLSLGNMIFVCAIWGYFFGFSGVFWVAITIALLLVGYMFFGKHFKQYFEDTTNSGSLHEFISSLYRKDGKLSSKNLRYFSSLVTIITLLLAIILELHIASTLFSQVFGISTSLTFLWLLAIIASYSCLGGLRTVIHTDILQSILMLLAIFAGLYFYFNFDSLGITNSEYSFTSIIGGTGWANSLGISFLGFGWLLVTMDTWQRNSASRNTNITFNGIRSSIGIMIVFVILFALFGMYIKDAIEPLVLKSGLTSSGGLFPFNDLFLISDLIREPFLKASLAIIFVGLIMAAASTADTFFVVMSHSFTTDILINPTGESLGSLNEKQNILFGTVGRIVIITSTFLIMIVWYVLYSNDLLNDPLNLFYISYSVQYALLPALIFGIFYKRKNQSTAIVSIIIGIITTLCIGFFFLPKIQAGDTESYWYLRPDQWLGLLPFITFVTSGTLFVILQTIKNKISDG